MANTLSNLIPDLYAAIDQVSREMVGFIPAVGRDSRAERAAKDETVRIPVTGEETAQDITPGVNSPDAGDTTVNNRTITISKSRMVPIRFTGEEIKGLKNQDNSEGDGYQSVRRDRMVQAMRTLTNEVETDLAKLAINASRAVGTAGTAPFGTKDDLTDFAGVNQVLNDNGAPTSDRQLVVGSDAMYNLQGKQTGLLQRINESGTSDPLRVGSFEQVHGLMIHNSQQVQTGQGGGTLTDVTANANSAGDTALDVETAGSTGSISVSPGDVITIAGDPNNYVIAESATVGAGQTSTTLTIEEPGLEQATSDGASITISSAYTANVGFHRNAIQLATRVPAIPEEGDMAIDRTVVQDPTSGLAFEMAVYPQYRQVQYQIGLAWGYAAIKSEHMALLRG